MSYSKLDYSLMELKLMTAEFILENQGYTSEIYWKCNDVDRVVWDVACHYGKDEVLNCFEENELLYAVRTRCGIEDILDCYDRWEIIDWVKEHMDVDDMVDVYWR